LFEIIFLGTSASAPSVHRGLSAQIIKHDEHRFLIDCGEGTQRQILKSGIGFKRLNRILITHSHLDHILGLGGLLSTFMRWEIVDELEIIGGRYALERIYELLMKVVLRGTRPPVDLRFREIQPGLIGVPPGPWRRELVNGTAINLPDGRTIHPDEVLGEEKPGTRIVHVGDTGHTEDLLPYAKGADVLVIEATYLQSEVDMARKFAHLTAKQSAELARDAGVGFLILTHISRRYRERDVLEEAQSVFPKTRVARDFDTVQVKRGSVELKSG